MAEAGPSGAGNEEADRSFDGFEEEDDKDEAMEIGGDGSRRRIFSKVSNYFIIAFIVRCFYEIMQKLRCMLYGYGDDRNLYTETVDFLEDVAIQFIIDRTSWYVVSRRSRQFVRSLNICNSQVGSVKDLVTKLTTCREDVETVNRDGNRAQVQTEDHRRGAGL